jgi:hypothetical protein
MRFIIDQFVLSIFVHFFFLSCHLLFLFSSFIEASIQRPLLTEQGIMKNGETESVKEK